MSHAPKHAMLIALTRKRLSADGRRRALAHLDQCKICRQAQAGHELLASATAAATSLEVPSVDYDRMALALRREARARALRESRRMLYGALTIAATVALAAFGASRLATRGADNVPDADLSGPAATAGDHARNDVSARTGERPQATAEHETTASAAAFDNAAITEGTLLGSESGELRVALWTGTEVVLRQGSLVRVAKLRGHHVRLNVERGAITSQVAKLQTEENFEIAVGDLVVAVRGTRFVVERSSDGRAQVALSDGVVVVTRGDVQLARLVAPAQWTEAPAATIESSFAARNALGKMDEGAVAERSPNARVAAGPDASRRRIDPTPTAVKHLFARAAPLLAKCHAESLRADAETPRAVVLAVTVSEAGQPSAVDVRASSGPVPATLVECIRGHVLTWHFPLDATASARLEIPLNFAVTR